eukprot:4604032-Pyramimonas_sp.AAC.1
MWWHVGRREDWSWIQVPGSQRVSTQYLFGDLWPNTPFLQFAFAPEDPDKHDVRHQEWHILEAWVRTSIAMKATSYREGMALSGRDQWILLKAAIQRHIYRDDWMTRMLP